MADPPQKPRRGPRSRRCGQRFGDSPVRTPLCSGSLPTPANPFVDMDAAASPVRLSVAVQTHPRRADLSEPLAADLTWQGANVEAVYDPEPFGKPNPWRCYRHCLATTPPGCTHRLVVQDDVLLSVGFVAAAEQALAHAPEGALLSFFHAGQPRENLRALDIAWNRGERYAHLNPRRWVPVLALAWPIATIEPFLAWVEEQNYPDAFRSDDEIVGRGVRALDYRVYATVPSLVQHEDIVTSLIGLRARAGTDPARVAHRWLSPPADARDLAWA